jgi:hypothetical protein
VASDEALRPPVHWHGARLLLAVYTAAALVSAAKGLSPHLSELRQFYWYLTYDDGFSRRALVGSLFHPLFRFGPLERLAPVIVGIHVALMAALVIGFFRMYDRALLREHHLSHRLTLTSSYLCLMTGPWLSTMAHDVGYVDVYVAAVVLGCGWLVLNERYVTAGFVGAIGPFIHEEFVFPWLCVFVLVVWSIIATRAAVVRKLCAVAIPLAALAVVLSLHDRHAELAELARMPLSQTMKDGLRAYAFGQTFRGSFDHMWQHEYPGHAWNAVVAFTFLSLPGIAVWLVAPVCYWPAWRHRPATLIVGLLAVLAPLTLLTFAWDVSRIAMWSNFAAGVVVMALGSRALFGR